MTSAEPLTSAFCTVTTSPTRADCFFIASSFSLMAGICSCFSSLGLMPMPIATIAMIGL
jgi:hypothetical protein